MDLTEAREKIQVLDRQMARLFEDRMEAVRAVAAYKKKRGPPIEDKEQEMKKLAEQGLDYAREQLEHRLQNFAAFTGRRLLLVFDGYRVAKSPGSQEERLPLEIVYTGENETADMHIERYLAERRGKKGAEAPAVVSNDNLIRLSVIRQGGLRLSCELFIREYEEAVMRLQEMTAAGGKALGMPAVPPALSENVSESAPPPEKGKETV